MLTSLGKFLRKLRIDHGEILKDMADKLQVTASFLSAVENGKKQMPSEWNAQICELYSLTDLQKSDFTTAVAETSKAIEMKLVEANLDRRELAVSFARSFSSLDDEQAEAIRNIIWRRKKT